MVATLIELEHRLARLEMMADQEPRLFELGEDAVHGREPYIDPLGEQLLVDILGSEMSNLALLEQVDDPQPRQRRLEARILEVVRRGHGGAKVAEGNARSGRPTWL